MSEEKTIVGMDIAKDGGTTIIAMDEAANMNMEPYEQLKPEVEIKVPDDYVKLMQSHMKDYKKFLKKNEKLQNIADESETEEEMKKALKEVTTHFKKRYAGVVAKDQGERLSPSKIGKIWDNFMKYEYRSFLTSHTNLSLSSIMQIGIDKFIYTLGWRKPSDTATWRKNKVRIGTCCHCEDQFVAMMFQHNHGLCMNCRPLYSVTAIRNYILHVMNISERYQNAHHDLLMDFYIMFYHDPSLRKLFLKGTESAQALEAKDKRMAGN